MAPIDHVVQVFYDECFDDNKDEVTIAANFLVAYDFRSHFLHDNTLLGAARDIITKASGETSCKFLRKPIFEPLDLSIRASRIQRC